MRENSLPCASDILDVGKAPLQRLVDGINGKRGDEKE
jgi:hypothetical protein